MLPHARLRTLQLLRTLDPAAGGPTTYLQALGNALEASSVEVRALGVFEHLADDHGVRLAAPWLFWRQLRRHITQVDAVHIHGVFGWHVLLGARLARRRGLPYVISTHGHLQPEALRQKSAKKALYMRFLGDPILRRSAAVMVTTQSEGEAVSRAVPGVRTELVCPAVNVPTVPAARDHVDQEDDAFLRLIYVGRLHPHKNLHIAVAALARLQDNGVAARLSFVGEGERRYVKALQDAAVQMGCGSRVEFPGFLVEDELLSALRDAHLLILPSRSENFSFAVAEAMAQGLPVILTEAVGLAATVEQAEGGRVVPVGDVDALVSAITSYVDKHQRLETGRRAHACAKAMLGFPAMRESLERVYSRVTIR